MGPRGIGVARNEPHREIALRVVVKRNVGDLGLGRINDAEEPGAGDRVKKKKKDCIDKSVTNERPDLEP
jgi:hypothetical protein